MKRINQIIIWIVFIVDATLSTIDVNESHLQHLVDHLTPTECRQLVAALHFTSYDEPNALALAERKMPQDISCLKLLEHWNSQEGKGQTHEPLAHRLRQMKRVDLAEWLDRAVFHQLGVDLEDSLRAEFDESTISLRTRNVSFATLEPLLQAANDGDYNDWLFDTVCYLIVIVLVFVLIGFCLRVVCRRRRRRRAADNTPEYFELAGDDDLSESEFDIREYNDNKTTTTAN